VTFFHTRFHKNSIQFSKSKKRICPKKIKFTSGTFLTQTMRLFPFETEGRSRRKQVAWLRSNLKEAKRQSL